MNEMIEKNKTGIIAAVEAPMSSSPLSVHGLPVFLDGDPELDRIRLTAKDPAVIIMAVAFRRAQQIAKNYASKHAPHLAEKISRATYEFTFRFKDEYLIPLESEGG